MKEILGILSILFGIVLGLYVGLYLCFIGGIVQVVEAVKSTPVEATGIAFGIVRIMFASFVGWLSFSIPFLVGQVLIES